MPGRLIMNQNGANGIASQGGNKTLVNGDHQSRFDGGQAELGNGVLANGVGPSPPAGQADVPKSMLDLPPEIRHITEGYQDLSKLLGRQAQICYNDLSDAISAMADIHVQTQPTTNGVGNYTPGHRPQNNTQENMTKKKILMEFAGKHRDKFIKLLVLSQWSRQVGEVSKLIDLSNWTHEQLDHYSGAAQWLGQLRINVNNGKVPNPDIRTALEVLSTGKAPWMPDLGYILPEPLTPREMLKSLKNLNTLLSIRINLQENLPKHLRNWSISSGRATFVAPGEFEFDVSIASEDPNSQFYFTDQRFLFSPAPQMPEGQFRAGLEFKANERLASDGLTGCFDLLQGFVLTHKISSLRIQAHDMLRSSWAGALNVENVHRALVIQYWNESIRAKSWIEIGIASGKVSKDKRRSRAEPLPRISVRWTCEAVEKVDFSLVYDWSDLSLERLLKTVIARHVGGFLSSVRDQIQLASAGSAALSSNLALSDAEPADCALHVSLGTAGNATTISVDPITGSISLKPSTAFSGRIEYELNSAGSPETIASRRIIGYLCTTLQASIDAQAEHAGWSRLQNLNIKTEATAVALKHDVIRQSFFRLPGWSRQWAVVVAINHHGDMWSIVELADGNMGDAISSAVPLIAAGAGSARYAVTQDFLHSLDRRATEKVSFHVTSQQLKNLRVSHKLEYEVSRTTAPNNVTVSPSTSTLVLCIKFSALMKVAKADASWAEDTLKLVHVGFERRNGRVQHIVRGTIVKKQAAGFNKLLTNTHDEDVAFHPNGHFTIVLRSPFGTPFVDQLTARLRAIDRLRNFVQILQAQKLACKTISLARIAFTYSKDLMADLSFVDGSPTRLRLLPPATNPHQRVRVHLERSINNQSAGFHYFTRILHITLPLCRAFDAIEATSYTQPERNEPQPASPFIHPRDLSWYRLSFPNPLYQGDTFDIRLRRRQDTLKWHLGDSTPSDRRKVRPERLGRAIRDLFAQDGNAWTGLRAGIAADVEGIEEAVGKLVEVMRANAPTSKDAPPQNGSQGEVRVMETVDAGGPRSQKAKPPQQPAQQQRSNGTGAGNNNEVIMLD